MYYQIFKKESPYDSDSTAKMVARYADEHLYQVGEILSLDSKNGLVRLKVLKVEEDHDLSRFFKEDFYHVYVIKI
jgi:hypothetical protein